MFSLIFNCIPLKEATVKLSQNVDSSVLWIQLRLTIIENE